MNFRNLFRRDPRSVFGPFQIAFRDNGLNVPDYMKLLNLSSRHDVNAVLHRIRSAVDVGNTEKWGEALFAATYWSPHLIGIFAALLWNDGKVLAPDIWQAIDSGSWVTPQLVVAAQLIDPNFICKCTDRVSAGCPVNVPIYKSNLEKHSAAGPATTRERSAKTLASIIGVFESIGEDTLVQKWRSEPRIVELLSRDFDESVEIAKGWRKEVLEILAEGNWTKHLPGI